MAKEWTTSICFLCWGAFQAGMETIMDEGYGVGFKEPFALKSPDEDTCFSCGITHKSGIYVRVDPRIQEQIIAWREKWIRKLLSDRDK